MNTKNTVLYFGYGANRSPSMMKAIIGRVPKGEPANLSGFELCIQTWNEIPLSARKILSKDWTNSFRSYIIRPTEKEKVVSGVMWYITSFERKLIDNWELTGLWYDIFLLTMNKRQPINIEIQVVNDARIKHVVNSERYETFLNTKQKMLTVAQACRLEYMQKSQKNLSKQ